VCICACVRVWLKGVVFQALHAMFGVVFDCVQRGAKRYVEGSGVVPCQFSFSTFF
jgi:hypothetical protein